jgi:succinate dehydrogenase / fumarate reductase cytochrome b subunit
VDHTRARPKNLNFFTLRFPLTAIASILHRISGFVLFLFIPLILWCFSFSLDDAGYDMVRDGFGTGYMKILIWMILAPFCYHLVAGIRHLLSDVHVGNTREGGKVAAMFVFGISALLIIMVGIWIW